MDHTLSVTAPVPQARPRVRTRPGGGRGGAFAVRAALALGVAVVLGMWWFSTSAGAVAAPASALTSLGELSGMVGGFLVCAQVLLIARVPWFENAVGLDRLVSWHRSLGASVLFLIVAHVLLLVFGGFWLLQRGPAVREAREWAIDGPRCPSISAAAFAARGQSAPQAFEFGDVIFARRFGHASCALIGYGGGRGFGRYPVCQFTSPDALMIRARGREVRYILGPGQPATVSVRRGRPACVMAARFTAEGDKTDAAG